MVQILGYSALHNPSHPFHDRKGNTLTFIVHTIVIAILVFNDQVHIYSILLGEHYPAAVVSGCITGSSYCWVTQPSTTDGSVVRTSLPPSLSLSLSLSRSLYLALSLIQTNTHNRWITGATTLSSGIGYFYRFKGFKILKNDSIKPP